MADKLTIDDLIAWGRDYEQRLKDHPASDFHVPRPLLDQYICAANVALAQQQQREKREKPRSRGGRPRGGMGEQHQRLVANGARPEDAERIVAQAKHRPVESVRRADKRARKKPPR